MCPWRAFNDHFVGRVLRAIADRESGNQSWGCARPSKRLVDGVHYLENARNRVQYELDQLDREQQERERQTAPRHGMSHG